MYGHRAMQTSYGFTPLPIPRAAPMPSPLWESKNPRVSCAVWRRPSMAEAGVLKLEGVVQHYDWGGHYFIPELLGMENATRRPFAELWIGAHAKAPSIVDLGGRAGASGQADCRRAGGHPRAGCQCPFRRPAALPVQNSRRAQDALHSGAPYASPGSGVVLRTRTPRAFASRPAAGTIKTITTSRKSAWR